MVGSDYFVENIFSGNADRFLDGLLYLRSFQVLQKIERHDQVETVILVRDVGHIGHFHIRLDIWGREFVGVSGEIDSVGVDAKKSQPADKVAEAAADLQTIFGIQRQFYDECSNKIHCVVKNLAP